MKHSILRSVLKPAAVAVILGAALSASVPSAQAGTTELKALQSALGVTPIGQATSQQLLAAFETVIAEPKFDKTKEEGVVAGEALKAAGPNALDAGDVFGAAIFAANGNASNPLSLVYADRNNFVALAASTAGAGSGLNVSEIPGLAATLFASDSSETFTTVALATKSKDGIGAIFGGRAIELFATDATVADAEADSVTLANAAIANKKLASSAQDISQWIAAEYTVNGADTNTLAVDLADGNAGTNVKLAAKIALGVVAGDPTNAGNIIHNLYGQQLLNNTNGTLSTPGTLPSNALVTALVKGATALAKSVAAVADIEEIEKVGNAFGQLIATPQVTKPTKGLLALSSASAIVKTLATAVMNKPRTDRFGATIAENGDANKEDEIAEVAAYMVGGLIGSPELAALTGTKAKTAAADLLKIITAASTIKPKVVKRVAQGPEPVTFAADVAASVALTVQTSTLDPSIKAAFQALLQDPKGATAKKIGGAAGASTVIAAVSDVYNNINVTRFENGNDPTGAIDDPETDIHPFLRASGWKSFQDLELITLTRATVSVALVFLWQVGWLDDESTRSE